MKDNDLEKMLARARDYWRSQQRQCFKYDREVDALFQRCVSEKLNYDEARAAFAELDRKYKLSEQLMFGLFFDDFVRRYWAADLEQTETKGRA